MPAPQSGRTLHIGEGFEGPGVNLAHINVLVGPRKLDLAFQAFFRRIKAGQTPGFPRFKASQRFSGFCYPDPAGWKLAQNGTQGQAKGRAESGDSVGRIEHGAPHARVQSGRGWYASACVRHAPIKAVAALLVV